MPYLSYTVYRFVVENFHSFFVFVCFFVVFCCLFYFILLLLFFLAENIFSENDWQPAV